MSRRDARIARLYLILFAVLTPFALYQPRQRLFCEDWLAFASALMLRPLLAIEVLTVHAKGAMPGREPSPAEAERKLQLALAMQADVASSLPLVGWQAVSLTVREVRGRGGAAKPDTLFVEVDVNEDERASLAGHFVLHGDSLVGIVASQQEQAEDGLLCIHLLNHQGGSAREGKTSWIAVAEPMFGSENKNAQPIKLIVEAAGRKAPWPLRAILSEPAQLDTRGLGYLARSVFSEELHPGLPKGLILGIVRDRVYEAEGFVLERYLEPLWDPRGLVQVSLLLESRVDAALFTKLLAAQGRSREPALARYEQKVLWSSPYGLSYHRFLLAGQGLCRGAAVLDGGRCIGRVLWALGGVGMAAALSEHESLLPLIWLARDAERVQALVLVGRGNQDGAARFRVDFPATDVQGDMKDGTLFTGTTGSSFPFGLFVAEVARSARGTLELPGLGQAVWPARVQIVAHPRGKRP